MTFSAFSTPQSWRTAEIRELALSIQPGFARQPDGSGQGVLQLRMPNISRSGFIDLTDSKFVDSTAAERKKYAVQAGDVIFNNTNSPELVGNAAVFEEDAQCVLSNHMTRIRVNEQVILPSFLAAVLHRYWETGQTQRRAKQWINQAAIDIGNLASFRIPLPPLSEQQRIVEILQEAEEIRRLRAEAETKTAALVPAIFQACFGDPILNPKRWRIMSLGQTINDTPKNGLYKPAALYGSGTPIIRIGDFSEGVLRNKRDLERVRISEGEAGQYSVVDGQILLNRVNSIEHLGKSVLVDALAEPTVYESNMMRLDPNTELVRPAYLASLLLHATVLAKLRAKAKKAINQASVNQNDVGTLRIPVPPLPVQDQFVSRLYDAKLLRLQGNASFRVGESLSNALVANGFSGRLTEAWRERHTAELIAEAQHRDSALGQLQGTAGNVVEMGTAEFRLALGDMTVVTDGNYRDLNAEQTLLYRQLLELANSDEARAYVTADSLGRTLDGPLRRNPQAIEGHLAVLAARGLVIPLSLEGQDEATGAHVFGNAYRLPRLGLETADGDEPAQPGDDARLRELERLAARLEQEPGGG